MEIVSSIFKGLFYFEISPDVMRVSRLTWQKWPRFSSRPLGGTRRDPCPVPAWRRKRVESVRISPHTHIHTRRDRAKAQEEGQIERDRELSVWLLRGVSLHGGERMTSTASERRAFAHKINRWGSNWSYCLTAGGRLCICVCVCEWPAGHTLHIATKLVFLTYLLTVISSI